VTFASELFQRIFRR